MITPMFTWIFLAMVTWLPPSSRNVRQLTEYVMVADAIVHASDDPLDTILLASITSFESRFAIHAVGKLHEQGPWQLMPTASKPNGGIPLTLRGQAKEALRRWREQGPCSYTGEAKRWHQPIIECPLALHRLERANTWAKNHPYDGPTPPSEEVAAR